MFTLAYCLFEIPTGMMGDRLGPRRVLTRIVVWWSTFTALTGAMTGYYPLLLTGQGARAGTCVPASRPFRPRPKSPFFIDNADLARVALLSGAAGLHDQLSAVSL